MAEQAKNQETEVSLFRGHTVLSLNMACRHKHYICYSNANQDIVMIPLHKYCKNHRKHQKHSRVTTYNRFTVNGKICSRTKFLRFHKIREMN